MPTPAPSAPAILFVCLGNICRSPLAEGALRHAAQRARLDLRIDSAGTGGWHVGDPPDRRAIATARRHGVDISNYRARQLAPADFHRFSHIFALDANNLADMRRIAPRDGTARTELLLDLVPGRAGESVVDPYYGDEAGFQKCWADVTAAADALIRLVGGQS
jgi:protein-tyrosine phosphatase